MDWKRFISKVLESECRIVTLAFSGFAEAEDVMEGIPKIPFDEVANIKAFLRESRIDAILGDGEVGDFNKRCAWTDVVEYKMRKADDWKKSGSHMFDTARRIGGLVENARMQDITLFIATKSYATPGDDILSSVVGGSGILYAADLVIGITSKEMGKFDFSVMKDRTGEFEYFFLSCDTI